MLSWGILSMPFVWLIFPTLSRPVLTQNLPVSWKVGLCLAACALAMEIWYQGVNLTMRKYCYRDPHLLPYCPYALVLGTRKWAGSHLNLYFVHRMDAAFAVFAARRTDRLILSGARFSHHLNQPEAMRQALLQRGIPEKQLVLHPQGNRTWQSLQHCREAGIQHLIIISQHFHNVRAVFIARYMGIQAYAFDARDVRGWVRCRVLVRERLARIRMLMDIIADQLKKYGMKI